MPPLLPIPKWALLLLLLASSLVFVRAADDEDPTEAAVSVVQLEPASQPVDVQAPVSQFIVPNGEEIWARAWSRVSSPSPEQGSGFFAAGDLLSSGFKTAKNFRAEKYSPDETGADLQVVVSAAEATQDGKRVNLKQMKLVFFMGERSLFAPQTPGAKKPTEKKADPKKKEGKPATDVPAAPRTSFMPMGGRVEISAPEASLDTTTNEGRATGLVKIEIYQRAKPGEVERPMAVLSTQRLQWRTWGEPSIGSMEIAIYTAREKGEALDPLVTGYYEVTQPGERPSTMRMQGRGMIFESGTLDHLAPVYDDDGRLAGGSRIARNRAIFRSDISIEMTASTLSALMPFQAPADANAKDKTPAKKDDKAPPAPSLTQVTCKGPAILDTAVVPYLKRDPNANLAKPADPSAAGGKEQLQPVLLARRFEFLNTVSLSRTPLDAEGKPLADSAGGDETRLACGHLRIQLPALQPQGGFGMAEYVEAVNGVQMKGKNTAGAISGVGAPAPSQDFSMQCERMYFDGPTGSMFLVGTPKRPAHAVNPQFEASAHQFSYQMKSQDFAMPLKGPKRLVIRGGTPDKNPAAKKGDAVLSFSQGDTIITWNGSLLRKLVRLPVPGGADRVKEVLTFSDNVSIEQPTGSLRMKAGNVKVVRPSPEGAVEYLEGVGGVDVTMGDQQIAGEKVTVEMIPGAGGKMEKDLITISGSRRKQTLATLIKGGSAARAEKFSIDRRSDNFIALGGTVAVVKREGGDAPEAPKPQAAQDAGGIFQGISLQQGGNLFIQCDGDFAKDGVTNTIRVQKNVIVRQPGLQLFADEVELLMDAPAAGAPASTTPAPVASGELFTADPQKIRCTGNIELIAQGSQWVQCDEMEYDVKTQRSILKMKDKDNDVRVYMKDEGGGSRVLCVRGSLELDGKSGTFKPGGMMVMLPYAKAAPTGRTKMESPAQRKVQK